MNRLIVLFLFSPLFVFSDESIEVWSLEKSFIPISVESFFDRVDTDESYTKIRAYSPVKHIGNVEIEDATLNDIYSSMKKRIDLGPFFCEGAEFLICSQSEKKWYYVFLENKHERFDFKRFSISPLIPLCDCSLTFVKEDYSIPSVDSKFISDIRELVEKSTE